MRGRVGSTVVAVLLVAALAAGCGEDESEGDSQAPSGGSGAAGDGSSGSHARSYQVPDSDCVEGFGHGLALSAGTDAEAEYLTEMVACTDESGTGTYLRNDSDALFILSVRQQPGPPLQIS